MVLVMPVLNNIALPSGAWNSLIKSYSFERCKFSLPENQCPLSPKIRVYFCCSSQEWASSNCDEAVFTVYPMLALIFTFKKINFLINSGLHNGQVWLVKDFRLSDHIFNSHFFKHLCREGWTGKSWKRANIQADYFFFPWSVRQVHWQKALYFPVNYAWQPFSGDSVYNRLFVASSAIALRDLIGRQLWDLCRGFPHLR